MGLVHLSTKLHALSLTAKIPGDIESATRTRRRGRGNRARGLRLASSPLSLLIQPRYCRWQLQPYTHPLVILSHHAHWWVIIIFACSVILPSSSPSPSCEPWPSHARCCHHFLNPTLALLLSFSPLPSLFATSSSPLPPCPSFHPLLSSNICIPSSDSQ